ncbi:hypothetical protein VTN96DRAFT_7497 [Rasamsonia emersonii]
MMLIDTILTLPGATIEAEYQRRIAAINAVIAFCDVMEGAPIRPGPSRKRLATDAVAPHSKRQEGSQEDEDTIALRQAIASVRVGSPRQRPKICFLCVGDTRLPVTERTWVYNTPGSLSRHLRRKHLNSPWPEGKMIKCNICSVKLESKMHLMNHAESAHGTVSRVLYSSI